MANICSTSYTITGNTAAIARLWETLQQLGVPDEIVRLTEWADELGIDYKARELYMRGEIDNAQVDFDSSDEGATLFVYTSTAWHGCHDFFQCLDEAVGDELTVSYMEIEPGCELYYIHDEGGAYEYACYVSACGDLFPETENPYETVEEAIDIWCETMGIARDGRSEEEMMQFINGYEYGDDSYFHIHLFTYE